MNEEEFKTFLITGCRGVHWSRIEAHVSCPGIPDLTYCANGVSGFVETKVRPSLRIKQYIWMKANCAHGGAPLIFWLHLSNFYIIRGQDAVDAKLHKSHSTKEWMRWSSVFFSIEDPPWFRVIWCLRRAHSDWVGRPDWRKDDEEGQR